MIFLAQVTGLGAFALLFLMVYVMVVIPANFLLSLVMFALSICIRSYGPYIRLISLVSLFFACVSPCLIFWLASKASPPSLPSSHEYIWELLAGPVIFSGLALAVVSFRRRSPQDQPEPPASL